MDKVRPVLIVSADPGNQHSNAVVVAALTTTIPKHKQPTNVHLAAGDPLPEAGEVLCRSLYTLTKEALAGYRADLSPDQMAQVDTTLCRSLGLPQPPA